MAEETLRSCFGAGFDVRVQMPIALGPDSEPDLAVVTGSPRDYRDAHPQTAVLIVEVTDTTLPYDREHKARLYAKAGIPEYWIVNLMDRCLEIHRDPEVIGSSCATYQSRSVAHPSDTVTSLKSPQGSLIVADLLP